MVSFLSVSIVLLNLCGTTNGFRGSGKFYTPLSQKSLRLDSYMPLHPRISTECSKHEMKLRCITDDDETYTDFDTLNSDNELEIQLARELYDELRAGRLGLPVESFLEWEDIQDVLSNGVIDSETMEIIIGNNHLI